MKPLWPEYIAIFAIGSAIGSFLNVVIHRVPKGESIVSPPSHCPICGHRIKPYENIPILSYLLLRGKCSGCGKRISWRYPLVESLMGFMAIILLYQYGWSHNLIVFGVFSAFLISLSAIDIATFRLPNVLTYTGAIAGVALTIAFKRDYVWDMILGSLVGFGVLILMSLIGTLLFRKESLGVGDLKLGAMIGLYLGPAKTAGMFICGVFLGALIGGAMILFGGRKFGQKIPFGPYLAAGAIVSLFLGNILWRWYSGMVGL
ncbi:MAG: prepilin peptidase [Calditrichota bacterium]